jgi:hypothetical protein
VGSFNLCTFFFKVAALCSFLYEDFTLFGAPPPPRGHAQVAITTYYLPGCRVSRTAPHGEKHFTFFSCIGSKNFIVPHGVPMNRFAVLEILPIIEAAVGRPSGRRQVSFCESREPPGNVGSLQMIPARCNIFGTVFTGFDRNHSAVSRCSSITVCSTSRPFDPTNSLCFAESCRLPMNVSNSCR